MHVQVMHIAAATLSFQGESERKVIIAMMYSMCYEILLALMMALMCLA